MVCICPEGGGEDGWTKEKAGEWRDVNPGKNEKSLDYVLDLKTQQKPLGSFHLPHCLSEI